MKKTAGRISISTWELEAFEKMDALVERFGGDRGAAKMLAGRLKQLALSAANESLRLAWEGGSLESSIETARHNPLRFDLVIPLLDGYGLTPRFTFDLGAIIVDELLRLSRRNHMEDVSKEVARARRVATDLCTLGLRVRVECDRIDAAAKALAEAQP